MSRQPHIQRGQWVRLASTGLWTQKIATVGAGQSVDRVRGVFKVLWDPPLAPTVPSLLLVDGWAFGIYVDLTDPPLSPLDPVTFAGGPFLWHQFTSVEYTVEGGNNLVTSGHRPTEFDAKGKRGPYSSGAHVFAAFNEGTGTGNGWTAYVGASTVVLDPP